jgi:hypothetical protein
MIAIVLSVVSLLVSLVAIFRDTKIYIVAKQAPKDEDFRGWN